MAGQPEKWNQYTKYLYRLYQVIDQAKSKAKCGSDEQVKLVMYGYHIYIKLLKSANFS